MEREVLLIIKYAMILYLVLCPPYTVTRRLVPRLPKYRGTPGDRVKAVVVEPGL